MTNVQQRQEDVNQERAQREAAQAEAEKSADRDVKAEEAALAAQISAEHAAKALEQAEADERAAAEAAKENPNDRLCPHCTAEMTQHKNPASEKNGAWHCSSCGCCFRGRKVRAGHPSCKLA